MGNPFDEIQSLINESRKSDDLGGLYNGMDLAISDDAFEEAGRIKAQILSGINDIDPTGSTMYSGLEEVIEKMKGGGIRLDPDAMGRENFLKVAVKVWRCVHEYHFPPWRTLVGCAMISMDLDPPMRRHGYKGPNRAFLDELLKMSSNVSSKEIMRREKSKLMVAIKNGRTDDVAAIKVTIRELHERELRD